MTATPQIKQTELSSAGATLQLGAKALTVGAYGYRSPSPPSLPQNANGTGAASVPSNSSGTHGYWLVGSDGGIFTFGSANFWGSTGSLVLQRPVVGITPTRDKNGYWLVASDGGVFAIIGGTGW